MQLFRILLGFMLFFLIFLKLVLHLYRIYFTVKSGSKDNGLINIFIAKTMVLYPL